MFGKYKQNITNVELYNQKVLQEEANFKVEFNPYYNKSFFELIIYLRENTPGGKDISDLSLKELYNIILDCNMLKDNEGNKLSLHVEITNSWLVWDRTWKGMQTHGIPLDVKISSTL